MKDKQLDLMGFCEYTPAGQNPAGKYYRIDNEFLIGTYWVYEKNGFLLDIQDLKVRKDYVSSIDYSGLEKSFFVSTYIKQANGECFSPYIPMTNNSLFTYIADKTASFNSILHGGFPYLAISLKFDTDSFCGMNQGITPNAYEKFEKIFLEYNKKTIQSIELISDSILNLDKTLPGADLILSGKMMEWIGISIASYHDNLSSGKLLTKEDSLAIEKVTNYIDNHYMLDLNQDLLERIALLSGTKLKKCFRLKTGLTITEYIQRKRIDMAEILLAGTGLSVKNVAESVGYRSHSRFSNLYKRYKGISPIDVKADLTKTPMKP